MNNKTIESFLQEIGFCAPPQNEQEFTEFTQAVIENLQSNEPYSFLVTVKHQKYTPPKLPMSERVTLIKAKKEFAAKYQKPLREYLDRNGINYPDIETGYTFPVDLTAEQARELKSQNFIQSVIADYPSSVTKI